jgi:hypothetical protein
MTSVGAVTFVGVGDTGSESRNLVPVVPNEPETSLHHVYLSVWAIQNLPPDQTPLKSGRFACNVTRCGQFHAQKAPSSYWDNLDST